MSRPAVAARAAVPALSASVRQVDAGIREAAETAVAALAGIVRGKPVAGRQSLRHQGIGRTPGLVGKACPWPRVCGDGGDACRDQSEHCAVRFQILREDSEPQIG